MTTGTYFPLDELKQNDLHKIKVFNALFQAYSECENYCSGKKDWEHLVRVASKHELCKRYGIEMYSDSYDTYPVYKDVCGNVECFGFAHDNWNWRTHSDMHYALSNPEGFMSSPYFIDPNKQSEELSKNIPTLNEPSPQIEELSKNIPTLNEPSPQIIETSSQTNTIEILVVVIVLLLIIIFYLII